MKFYEKRYKSLQFIFISSFNKTQKAVFDRKNQNIREKTSINTIRRNSQARKIENHHNFSNHKQTIGFSRLTYGYFFPVPKRFHKLCLKVVYMVVRTECAKKSSKCIQWGQCVLDWRNWRCLKSVKSTPSTWRMFLSNQLSYVQCKSNIRVFCVNAWTVH